MLEAAQFDLEFAGAQLLGADIARSATPEAANRIRDLLESELEPLIEQVFSSAADDRFPELLVSFQKGFRGVKRPA